MCDNGIYHIGCRFFVNKNYIDSDNLLNKIVRIVEHDINMIANLERKKSIHILPVK